jgi:Amidohydrolase
VAPVYAEELIAPWLAVQRDRIPQLDVVDVHVHVGLADPGGLLATQDEALASLALAEAHGVVFPLREPGGYRRPNESVLELGERARGRVTAMARIDPADDPLSEAVRCLDAGAAGVKLHPRGEGFALDDRRLDEVFALADERRLPRAEPAKHLRPGLPVLVDLSGMWLARPIAAAVFASAQAAAGGWRAAAPPRPRPRPSGQAVDERPASLAVHLATPGAVGRCAAVGTPSRTGVAARHAQRCRHPWGRRTAIRISSTKPPSHSR